MNWGWRSESGRRLKTFRRQGFIFVTSLIEEVGRSLHGRVTKEKIVETKIVTDIIPYGESFLENVIRDLNYSFFNNRVSYNVVLLTFFNSKTCKCVERVPIFFFVQSICTKVNVHSF